MADVAVLSEQIQGLTLMEASELVKDLEEKLGLGLIDKVNENIYTNNMPIN